MPHSLLSGVGAFQGTQAAPSDWCRDGTPGQTEIPVLTSPIYVAAQINPTLPHVEVCYSTDPAAPGVASGAIGVITYPEPPHGRTLWAYCASDPGVRQPVDCNVFTAQRATPTTSGTSVGAGGAVIGLQIPFQVCTGSATTCTGSSPNVAQTGVILGALGPVAGPSGAVGAGYGLSFVEVWVDGVMIHRANGAAAGAFVTPQLPGVEIPGLDSTPPCAIGGVCLGGSLGITGATETVTLILPTGTTSHAVTIPGQCIVNFDGSC